MHRRQFLLNLSYFRLHQLSNLELISDGHFGLVYTATYQRRKVVVKWPKDPESDSQRAEVVTSFLERGGGSTFGHPS